MMDEARYSRHIRALALNSVDVVGWWVALGLALAARPSADGVTVRGSSFLALLGLAVLVQVGTDIARRNTLGAYRIGSIDETQGVVASWALTAAVVVAANFVVLGRPVPAVPLILALPAALTVMLGIRLGWRVWRDRGRRPSVTGRTERVLVFGAGEGGEQIVRSMTRDPDSRFVPVALLDDDPAKARRRLSGVPVRGGRHDVAAVARATRADVLLIAIPSAPGPLVAELDALGRDAGLDVRVLPTTTELVGMLSTADIRELTETDLLGRDEVHVDYEAIRHYLSGRRVLVTGAGGSIGSELCRQLARLDCAALIMLDRDESGLHGTQLSIEGRALLDTRSLVVADIRDRDRIFEVFDEHKPDVVFHAAALKHLSLLEQYPSEGHKTNVEGTANVLDAAETYEVGCFVNVSTDKAADPSSVLGRTKQRAEQLTAAKAASGAGTYVSVRFGNVLGSRGSVLPIFRHQIASGGPVTITDPEVTRYFMTIPEAVRLVLQAGAIGEPGEVMILDMGEPVKIVDLARQLIRYYNADVEIVYTGLRPGEKMHELLISAGEETVIRSHPRIMHARPAALAAGESP